MSLSCKKHLQTVVEGHRVTYCKSYLICTLLSPFQFWWELSWSEEMEDVSYLGVETLFVGRVLFSCYDLGSDKR